MYLVFESAKLSENKLKHFLQVIEVKCLILFPCLFECMISIYLELISTNVIICLI